MRARVSAALAALVVLAVTGCAAVAPDAAPSAVSTPEPIAVDSMAVVGDSMSVGMSACGRRDACPEASWALGSDPAVDSIAQRLAGETGQAPATVSIARPGATVADRVDALSPLEDADADLVLVQIGANDACTSAMSAVTPPASFASSYAALLAGIRAEAPDAAIVAFSVPDLLRLWEIGRADSQAVQMWNASPSCRSLLQDADSDAAADVERRASVDAVVRDYNAAIADACSAVPGCTSDGGAVFDIAFTTAEIAPVDHFHPSLEGQAVVAATAWPVVQRALQR